MENESFNQTAESEDKCFSNNSGQVSLETYSSIVDQPLENEIRDSLTDRFRKPYEKPKEIGTKDKIIEEIKKGREERLAVLKEMRQGKLCNNPIQFFFKSMASTVATFPPELAVEAKTKVFNIISELVLRALKAKASNTTSVESIVTLSPIPSKQIVPTILNLLKKILRVLQLLQQAVFRALPQLQTPVMLFYNIIIMIINFFFTIIKPRCFYFYILFYFANTF